MNHSYGALADFRGKQFDFFMAPSFQSLESSHSTEQFKGILVKS